MKKSKKMYYYFFEISINPHNIVCNKIPYTSDMFYFMPRNFKDAYCDFVIERLDEQLKNDLLFEYSFQEKWDDPFLNYVLNNKIKIVMCK